MMHAVGINRWVRNLGNGGKKHGRITRKRTGCWNRDEKGYRLDVSQEHHLLLGAELS